MNTHSEVGYRAFLKFVDLKSDIDYSFYKNAILSHPSYFQSGPPFPDWGYLCNLPAGEYSHWPPFTRLAIDYIKSKYSKNSVQYLKFVAFIFGIESHQIADVIWHWGKEHPGADMQGFLRAMAHSASYCKDIWNGNEDPNCHSIGDTGADMYLSNRGGLKDLSQIWSIPIFDIEEVYKIAQQEAPQEKLCKCVLLMYLGAKLERIASFVALKKFEKNAEFLTEDLELYFSGGLDDMALNTVWEWQNLVNIFEGKSKNFSKSFEHAKSKKIKRNVQSMLRFILEDDRYEIYQELIGLTTVRSADGDLHLDHSKEMLQTNEDQITRLIHYTLYPKEFYPNYYQPITKYTIRQYNGKKISLISNQPYSYFGKSITTGDFNGDGIPDTAFGAPGYLFQNGAVYIIQNNDFSAIKYNEPTLIGKDIYSRFGYSLTTVDINHDGFDDLVVSAPAFGKNGPGQGGLEDYYPKDNVGKIFIYFGCPEGITNTSNPDIEIITKNQDEVFYNLGYFIGSGDCNNDGFKDLLIGSPYSQQGGDKRGSVGIFTKINSQYNFKVSQIYIEEADFYLVGESNYQEFGNSIKCDKSNVYIGSRGSRLNNENIYQGAGSVSAYNFNTKEIIFKIFSEKQQSRFGYSIDILNNLLLVGAPGFSVDLNSEIYQTGLIYVYDTTTLNINSKENDYINKVEGKNHRSRLGQHVKFWKEGILVSSPHSSSFFKVEDGSLLFYDKINSQPKEIPEESYDLIYRNNLTGSRFGDKVEISDINSDNIIISAPYSTSHSCSGEITILG